MATLGQKLKILKRRYLRITSYRFMYNAPAETRKLYRKMDLYLLLHAEFGYTLMRIPTNHSPQTPNAWYQYLKTKWIPDAWPKVREHLAGGGADYRLVDLIGFSGEQKNVVQKSDNSKASKTRSKTR